MSHRRSGDRHGAFRSWMRPPLPIFQTSFYSGSLRPNRRQRSADLALPLIMEERHAQGCNVIGGPPGSTSPGVLSGNVVTTPQLSQGVSPSPQAGSPSVGSGNGATTVFSYSGKLQTFTVPTTGTYDIVAEGAQGGFTDSVSIPGKGAEVGGDFQLTAGEMLSIVAGGQGQQANFASSLFSVGRNIRLLLHRTTVPTWSVFLGSADRGGFFVPA
jgi:hypothetical protein